MAEPELYPKQPTPEQHLKKQGPDAELLGKIAKNVNTVAANLRVLEDRYSTLRNKSQLTEQNLISLEKDMGRELKMLSEDILEAKRSMKDIRDKLGLISKEIENLVSKDDFRVIERYIDMWQPLNFVTRNELLKMIEEAQRKKASSQSNPESAEAHNNQR